MVESSDHLRPIGRVHDVRIDQVQVEGPKVRTYRSRQELYALHHERPVVIVGQIVDWYQHFIDRFADLSRPSGSQAKNVPKGTGKGKPS